MRIPRHWPFWVYAGTVPLYHSLQITSCDCEPRLALERQPRPDPVQPEGWDRIQLEPTSRPSASTSRSGTTVYPGTGEAVWRGFAPSVRS